MAKTTVYVPRLKTLYKDTIVKELQSELELTNIHQVPKLEKIVVSVGTGKKKEERPPYFRDQLLSEKKADSTSSVIAYTDNKSPTEVKLISVFAKNLYHKIRNESISIIGETRKVKSNGLGHRENPERQNQTDWAIGKTPNMELK